jgi:sigma-E factor negative regulatory protein RseA
MVMREQISRLMDGDLEGAEAEAAFRELKQVDGLEHWTCYHIIGDVLRRNGVPTAGFASRFAARLDAEPTVLAPQRAQSAQPSRLPLAWAVAATVAAVAVVSSVAVSMFDTKPMAIATAVEAGNLCRRTISSRIRNTRRQPRSRALDRTCGRFLRVTPLGAPDPIKRAG